MANQISNTPCVPVIGRLRAFAQLARQEANWLTYYASSHPAITGGDPDGTTARGRPTELEASYGAHDVFLSSVAAPPGGEEPTLDHEEPPSIVTELQAAVGPIDEATELNISSPNVADANNNFAGFSPLRSLDALDD
jgi:hypothetical protein